MGINLVPGQIATNTATSAATTITVTLPNVPTVGNLVVAIPFYTTANGTLTVSDGNGHSFTPTPSSPANGSVIAETFGIYYLNPVPASPSAAITATGSNVSSTTKGIWVAEFSGATAFNADALSINAGPGLVVNTPVLNLTANGQLIIAKATSIGFPFTFNAPFINLGNIASGLSAEYQIQGIAAPVNPNINLNSNHTWDSIIASFFGPPPSTWSAR